MSEKKTTFELKLSPAMTAVVVIILLIAGGGVYVVKPEWITSIASQASSGASLTQSRYYPKIEENLNVTLRGAVIRHLVERGATQAEFDAAQAVAVQDISAETIGYYRTELEFWQARDLRRVELFISFTCGGKAYRAEGEMTVSGSSNLISLSDVTLTNPSGGA